MALDHLLAALERDGTAQAEKLLADARATAAAMTREADERVAQRRHDALAAREATVRESAESALVEARRTSRQRVLSARQRVLDQVFAAAHALLPEAVNGPSYRTAVPRHVADALEATGEEPVEIRCPDALVPVVRAFVASRPGVSVRGDAAARPGIVVTTTDGVIKVDQTLGGRLERQRARIALEVLARLDTSG